MSHVAPPLWQHPPVPLFQKVLITILQLQTCTMPSNLEDDIPFMHSPGSNKTHFIYQKQPKRQDSDLPLWKKANSAHNFNYLG